MQGQDTGASTLALADSAHPQHGAGAGASGARICQACQGSGEEQYEYHFRAMTRTCESCDGEGLCGGKRLVSAEAQRQEKAASVADQAAAAAVRKCALCGLRATDSYCERRHCENGHQQAVS